MFESFFLFLKRQKQNKSEKTNRRALGGGWVVFWNKT